MSSPILFYILMAIFLGLTLLAASEGSWLIVIPGLLLLTGVSLFLRRGVRKNRKMRLWTEFLLFYAFSFVGIAAFWWFGIFRYDDNPIIAIVKIAILSILAGCWLMGAVRADIDFPGMFRDLLSRTLPDKGPDPPKNFVEALALRRTSKIKRALRENPKLMEEKGSWGETPLHWMARANDWKNARILLDCGIEVDARDDANGETPLHYAATEGNRKVMNVLVRAGADLNAQNKDGDTPLHWASHGGHFDAAQYLLDEGADPRVQNLEGVDCLDVARNMNHTKIEKMIQGHLDRIGG